MLLFLSKVLELVRSSVWGGFALAGNEFDVHEGVAAFDCDGFAVVAEVYDFEGEASYEAAVDFGGVEEAESHASVLALGCEVGDEVWGGEDDLVAGDVLVFEVVECGFFFDGEDVAVAVEEVVVVGVDYALLFY